MEPTNLKPKKQNIISERKSCVVDIISNLPDSVLSHILSFLPTTKEAVATSILSKRWRSVWTFVDTFFFDESLCLDYRQKLLFWQFVSNVLKLHKGNIKEFKLRCYGYNACKNFDITSWIETAIARGVQTLDLTTAFFDVKFPNSMFSSKTLTVLKLNDLSNISMNIPSSPIFPRLKKLYAPCFERHGEHFKRIVSQCSTLEYLIVINSATQIEIVSSSIKCLDILCVSPSSVNQKIILGVPSLEYLKIRSKLTPELIVEESLLSLIEADIALCSTNGNARRLHDSFARFIQPLFNVKVLRLHSYYQKFLNSVGHGRFLNLSKLDIVSNFFEWRLLASLMESSVNLEVITLKKVSALENHEVPWIVPKKVPTCLSSSLRKISIDGCSEDELPMVKYVLRNAQILERMDIYCPNNLIQKIQKLPRASVRCEISLLKKFYT